jgi:DNA-binding transcriptional regulator YiaG
MFMPKSIKEHRIKEKMTRDNVARAMEAEGRKITPQTLYNWEKGKTAPEAPDLAVLSLIFNVPVSSFFALKMKRSTLVKGNGRLRDVHA